MPALFPAAAAPLGWHYPLHDLLALEGPDQFRALFEDTRIDIIELLSERAATTSQLADALGRPKGTIGHHLGVLADAGLVRVVRTKKVRALEAKGPTDPETLSLLVGADYWEAGRFDRALALAASDGLVFLTGDGKVSASG